MTEHIDELKEAEKEKLHEAEAAHAGERESRHEHRHSKNNWVPGLVLIAIGVVFLFSNLNFFYLDNWWALFILIPAFSNLGRAFSSYQRNGRLTRSARGSLTGGLVLTLVAGAFLFNLNWGFIWPIFLILAGISALLGGWFD